MKQLLVVLFLFAWLSAFGQTAESLTDTIVNIPMPTWNRLVDIEKRINDFNNPEWVKSQVKNMQQITAEIYQTLLEGHKDIDKYTFKTIKQPENGRLPQIILKPAEGKK